MHDALECLCLDKAVLDVALTKYFESRCDPNRCQNRYGMYLSGQWRMFLHAVDLTVVFLSTVLMFHSLHVPPYARMHTLRTHLHTTFFAARTRKRKHTQALHGTTL